MRELTVSFSNNGKATLGSVVNYQDEHCATCLAVTLGADLTAGNPDEYYISFVRDFGLDNPRMEKMTVGPISDIRSGVLYYELPSSLTNTTSLAVQLEAVKKDSDGKAESVVKSPAFVLSFENSLTGDEVLLVTDDGNSLIARLLGVAAETLGVKNQVQAALLQGQFNAKINGHNAVTISGGRNLTLNDSNGAITIDCSTLPLVNELPQNPQSGEVFLLAAQNEITYRAAGKELLTSNAMLSSFAREEMELQMQQSEPRTPLTITLKKGQTTVGFVSAYSDVESVDDQNNYVCSVDFCTKTQNNQPHNYCEIVYINGAFSSERSSASVNGVVSTLDEVPISVRLPDFDSVEAEVDEAVLLPAFYAPISVWVYLDRWVEITSLVTEFHTHNNKKTLDGFFAAEDENASPLAPQTEGWGRLTYSGQSGGTIRFCEDGGVVKNTEAVTVNGQTFLRLWLDYGWAAEIGDSSASYNRPAFIDIPVSTATASTVTVGTESVTGTEIDFGIGELETDSHTHSNKNLLDSLADMNFGGVFRFCKGVDPVDKIPIKNCGNNATLVLYGGVYNKFGNSSSPAGSIAVTGFYCSGGGAQEYILDFYSGSTPTSLTLPDSVQWANELTIEANKHYQVSIVDNIALWTAVGTEEDEDE